MRYRLPICLTTLVLAAAILAGCGLLTGRPPSIGTLTLTDRVDERTQAALNPLTNLPHDTTRIFLSVQVENARKGTRVEGRWLYDKLGQGNYGMIDRAEVTFDVTGDRYVAFSLTAATPLPPGAYKAVVYLDGKQAAERAFYSP